MLDQGTVIGIARQYADAVTKEFSPSAIILFGSYVNGKPDKDSDVDIGVVFNGFIGDWLSTSAKLWDLAYDISWDIEPHLLDRSEDRSGFVRHVYKTGQVIWSLQPTNIN